MNSEKLEQLRNELNATCEEVLLSKGKDYAGEGEEKDRLANFKMVGELLDMFGVDNSTPLGAWAVYYLKHVFAILAYIGQHTESEPIAMRFADARNYLDLGYALVVEQTPSTISSIDPLEPHSYVECPDRMYCAANGRGHD